MQVGRAAVIDLTAASTKALRMNETDIRTALKNFDLGEKLDGVHVADGFVQVSLAVKREEAAASEPLRRRIEAMLRGLPGVKNAAVVFTAHKQTPLADPAPAPSALSGIGAVIAVASGKGGVGKSTVAVNLAIALSRQGLKVGLLDADIYGPSMPRMLGLNAKPEIRNGMIIPLSAWGIVVMSIGFLVDDGTAMVWRGPMATGALNQMLTQVEWGALDCLVIDMPPGTGDIQLTLAQRAKLTGAVIVSTPQDIALIDARRGIKMFQQVNVPVLGLVENMSYFECPHCHEHSHIFGHGGAAAEATKTGIAFLGEVPLVLEIRETSDAGTPICASAPESASAAAFEAIARRVQETLGQGAPKAPKIVFE